MLRRNAMKYKSSTTSSLHWCGAWGDIWGKLALRAGGRRQSLSLFLKISHLKPPSPMPRDRPSPLQMQQAKTHKMRNYQPLELATACYCISIWTYFHLAIAPCLNATGLLKGESSSLLEQPCQQSMTTMTTMTKMKTRYFRACAENSPGRIVALTTTFCYKCTTVANMHWIQKRYNDYFWWFENQTF